MYTVTIQKGKKSVRFRIEDPECCNAWKVMKTMALAIDKLEKTSK